MKSRLATATVLFGMIAHGQTPDPNQVISRMKEAARVYAERLQDFVCTQLQKRSIGSSPGGPHWKLLERQVSVLEYVNHKEHYSLLEVNGETLEPERRIKRGHFLPGGEYATALRKIFDPKAQAVFDWDREERSGAAHICVFRYSVPQATSTVIMQADADHVQLGHHGMVWADCDTGAVTRFQMETDMGEVTRMGRKVPLGQRLEVRYAPAMIGSQEFLLPEAVDEAVLFYKTWTRVEIQFQEYRKYDANSVIRFDGHF